MKKCIGILGGGQLARMSTLQAIRMGFDVAIMEKEKDSPAGILTKKEFVGWVNDADVLKAFIETSDIITLENEFINAKYLEVIESSGKKVVPSSKTISLIQDKYIQKSTLHKNKIPVAPFLEIDKTSSYANVSGILGSKFLLKSRTMGYDGYGNYLVENEDDFKKGTEKLLKRSKLMVEGFISFTKELAVMVVRSHNEIKVYPVVETIQQDHICHKVIAPAAIDKKLYKEAADIAIECVKAVDGFGIFGIEMFLTIDNKIIVNEMAPRPHNSGHYTIEGCVTSQFENHIRAVLDLPLGSTKLMQPFAVMLNVLGKKNGEGVVNDYKEVLCYDDAHLHIYGKQKSRIGRKMGHITLTGKNLNELLNKVNELEKINII